MSFTNRGGYRTARSLRPMVAGGKKIACVPRAGTEPTRDDLREMLAEAARNTADAQKDDAA